MKQKIPSFFFYFILLFLTASASSQAEKEKIESIALSYQRVITLAPHLTEILLSINGGKQLIATPSYTKKLPSHTTIIKVLGGIDRELLLALQPDLVLAWTSGNKASDLYWIESQKIPLFKSDPKNIDEIAESFVEIANLIGQKKDGEKMKIQFLNDIRNSCSEKSNQEALIKIWGKPDIALGGKHWINDAIEKIGVKNTFKKINKGTFFIEREALVSKGDILTISTYEKENMNEENILSDLSRPGPDLPKALSKICTQYLTIN